MDKRLRSVLRCMSTKTFSKDLQSYLLQPRRLLTYIPTAFLGQIEQKVIVIIRLFCHILHAQLVEPRHLLLQLIAGFLRDLRSVLGWCSNCLKDQKALSLVASAVPICIDT